MKSVAVIILNYKTGKMTDQLYKLMTELDSYENKDVYVFNNGPDDSCKSACHTFEKNIHFTNGSIFGYEYAKSKKTTTLIGSVIQTYLLKVVTYLKLL